MSLFCPSCSKEITSEMTECRLCGYAFGPGTLNLLTSGIEEMLQEYPSERRKDRRVRRRFKVTYSSQKTFINSYLFNISAGGLFIETNDPPTEGELISLKVFLPDGSKELDVLGEVVWSNREGRVKSEKKYPPGMGVKFLNLSTEDKIRISVTILEKPK